jgi:hypothetical protein
MHFLKVKVESPLKKLGANMLQLSKENRIQILSNNFYALNKWFTKKNGEESYCRIVCSANINNHYDIKECIKYSEIENMNDLSEIINYLKK